MNHTGAREFELGQSTGRLFAPSPFWLAGYLWGSWIGLAEKAFQWQ